MIQLDYNRRSFPVILFLSLKHSFNPSIFIVPCAFRNGGYILSIIFILVILAVSFYTTLALSQTKAVVGKEKRRYPEEMNWGETVTNLFRSGKVLRGLSSTIENVAKLTEWALHISKCAVYVLTAAKLTRDLSIEFYSFDVDVVAFVVAWAIPFTLIAVMSNMKNWNKVLYSFGAVLVVACLTGLIFLLQQDYTVRKTEIDAWGELEYLPSSFGLLLFCFSYLSPISNPELRVTESRQYRRLAIGVLIYAVILISFALFCYLGLNEMVATSVLCNFQGSFVSYLTKGCSIVSVVLFYGNEFADAMSPLQLNFDDWSSLMFFEDWDVSTARAFVNLFGCAASVVIAMAIPSLEILCALVGIILVLVLNIMIPLFFHTCMIMNTRPYGANAKIALNVLLLFFSAAVFISSTIYLMFQVFTLRRYFQFS